MNKFLSGILIATSILNAYDSTSFVTEDSISYNPQIKYRNELRRTLTGEYKLINVPYYDSDYVYKRTTTIVVDREDWEDNDTLINVEYFKPEELDEDDAKKLFAGYEAAWTHKKRHYDYEVLVPHHKDTIVSSKYVAEEYIEKSCREYAKTNNRFKYNEYEKCKSSCKILNFDWYDKHKSWCGYANVRLNNKGTAVVSTRPKSCNTTAEWKWF